jgi:hypothetical protein
VEGLFLIQNLLFPIQNRFFELRFFIFGERMKMPINTEKNDISHKDCSVVKDRAF